MLTGHGYTQLLQVFPAALIDRPAKGVISLIGGGQVYVLLFDVRYKPGAYQAQGLDYLKIQFDNLPLPL